MSDASALLFLRAGGRCERCGAVWHPHGWSRHHRQPRGMGGTKRAVHGLSNLLLLCGSGTSGCHGWVESHRADAYEQGLLVRRPTDPATVPVWRWRPGGHAWVLLTDDGSVDPVHLPPVVPPPRKDQS